MPILDIVLYGLVAVSSAVYALLVLLYRLSLRGAESEPNYRTQRRVSVLKPLAGLDDDLEDNLRSFARLEGPDYELLLGVADPADPAFEVARRFVLRHPDLDARIVLTDAHAAMNPKVAQLMGLADEATGEIFVVSDSNVRVAPDYLLRIIDALEQPDTHLVSTLVRGTGARSLGAALENTILATHVAPGVCAGYMLTRRAITIGKSMAMWRASLDLVGGFASVADVLAEDHALGQAFHRAGLGVAVIPHFVENRNTRCSFARSVERHARWAIIRRTMVPAGFAAEPLLTPMVVAGVAALILGTPTALVVFCATAWLQALGALVCLDALGEEGGALRAVVLEWTRTAVLFGCWLAAWVTRTVTWRGHRLHITAGSRIVLPTDAAPESAVVTGRSNAPVPHSSPGRHMGALPSS